jgi:hypothetical protein
MKLILSFVIMAFALPAMAAESFVSEYNCRTKAGDLVAKAGHKNSSGQWGFAIQTASEVEGVFFTHPANKFRPNMRVTQDMTYEGIDLEKPIKLVIRLLRFDDKLNGYSSTLIMGSPATRDTLYCSTVRRPLGR